MKNIWKTIVGASCFAAGWTMSSWFKPTIRKKYKIILTIIELESDDIVIDAVEVIAEESNRNGLYRFFKPTGQVIHVDLSDGFYRIIRKKIPV